MYAFVWVGIRNTRLQESSRNSLDESCVEANHVLPVVGAGGLGPWISLWISDSASGSLQVRFSQRMACDVTEPSVEFRVRVLWKKLGCQMFGAEVGVLQILPTDRCFVLDPTEPACSTD